MDAAQVSRSGLDARTLQSGVLLLSIVNTAWALAGMIANPDFGVNGDLTSERILGIDFNGWHALSGLLVFVPGLVASRRPEWARLYCLAIIPAVAIPGLWGLIDDTPMGIWFFEDNVADAILHFGTAAGFVVVLALARARGR